MVEGYTEEFERLKSFIAFIAQNLCELDNTVQKFNRLRSGESQFSFDLKIVFINDSYVILEYWGTEVNTQFDVVFECSKDNGDYYQAWEPPFSYLRATLFSI